MFQVLSFFVGAVDLAASFFLFVLLCWLCPSCLSGVIMLIVFFYSICLIGDAPSIPSRPSQKFLGCCVDVACYTGALFGPSVALLLPPYWMAVALLLAFLVGLSFIDISTASELDCDNRSIQPSLHSPVSSSSPSLAKRRRRKRRRRNRRKSKARYLRQR